MSRTVLDHIAIAVPRLADAPKFLVGTLGAAPAFGMTTPTFTFAQWRFAGGGRIEVLEPRGDDSFLHRFLAQRGPGIHHVTVKVPSLSGACERARGLGYAIVGYDDSNPFWKEAFLHPREALGIVVQLAEAHGDPTSLHSAPPPGPPDPPPAVTLLGLRLVARSVERARRQWHDVLLGECVGESARELVYRWPGAPLRLAVEIDAARDEGPLAIELAADRPLSLPAGPEPLLGAVFVQRVT